MKNKNKKRLAILGGMGPQASLDLYKKIIEKSIKMHPSPDNEDYPDIVLYSIPVPDFISNLKKRDAAFDMLQERVREIDQVGAQTICIACNTVHMLLDKLQQKTKIHFTSMIDIVASNVAKSNVKTVGLLASPSTIKYKLYQKALAARNIKTMIPTKSQIVILNTVIRNILEGKKNKTDANKLVIIARALVKKGAKAIVLGCTELPILFPDNTKLKVFRSTDILAQNLCEQYYETK